MVPSTHTGWFTTACDSHCSGPNTFWTLDTEMHLLILSEMYTNVHKNECLWALLFLLRTQVWLLASTWRLPTTHYSSSWDSKTLTVAVLDPSFQIHNLCSLMQSSHSWGQFLAFFFYHPFFFWHFIVSFKKMYGCGCFVCMYVCVLCACLVPKEGRRGHGIPWNWTFMQLWGTTWFWESNPSPLEEHRELLSLKHLSRPVFIFWF